MPPIAPHAAQQLEVLLLAGGATQQRICVAASLIARRVMVVAEPQALMRQVWARTPDVIIVEAAQPLEHVPSLCRQIRKFFPTPILVVEEGAREDERIGWLDSGADDVLALAAQAELAARCVALQRRIQRQRRRDPASLHIHACNLQLDVVGCRLYAAGGQSLNLSADHTRLLAILFSCDGGIVTDRALAQHMTGNLAAEAPRRLPAFIHRLNRDLQAAFGQMALVERVRGSGYRLRSPSVINIDTARAGG